MRFFLSLFLPLILFATTSESIRFEHYVGYREDHFKWRLQSQPSTVRLKEDYDQIKFMQNNFALTGIARDFYYLFSGGFAVFGRGKVEQTPFGTGFGLGFPTFSTPRFQFETSAFGFNGIATIGYFANLTPDRYYTIAIVPVASFSGYYERISKRNSDPSEFISTDIIGPAAFYTLTSESIKDLKLSWYGPSIGVQAFAAPGNCFQIKIGWAYHWLAVRHDFGILNRARTFGAGNVLLSDVEFTRKGKLSCSGNNGHSGFIQIDCLLTPKWRIGALGQILYFFSKVKTLGVDETRKTFFPFPSSEVNLTLDQRFKIRWTSLYGLFEVGYTF